MEWLSLVMLALLALIYAILRMVRPSSTTTEPLVRGDDAMPEAKSPTASLNPTLIQSLLSESASGSCASSWR